MSGPPEFRDLVGDDVGAEERERLLRVHELLVTAGPPPELPPSLEQPSSPGRVGMLPSRRRGAWLALAAALAAAAFGAGYLVAERGEDRRAGAFATDFTLKMRGTQAAPAAVASLVVGEKDDDGNWPMEMTVRGLPRLPEGERYELRLTKNGGLGPSCGTFLVQNDNAVAHLNAPFQLREYDGWAIVREGSSEILVRTAEI